MKIKRAQYYEAKIYIGSVFHYNGPKFSLVDLKGCIYNFQINNHDADDVVVPVRITPTNYQAEAYFEPGWEISVINYPRKPRKISEIKDFALGLAEHLLDQLRQNRVSVILPDTIIMFESDDAMEKATE